MAKKKPEEGRRKFKVGEQVRVRLRTGEIVDATIKAVNTKTKSVRLQVDYGKDETALIYDWQVEGR
jgi:transcription antitermination factor NusG